MKTYSEQLEEVQTAITKIVTLGQSYTIEGRTLTRADLRTLYDREKVLMPLAAREASGGARVRYGTPA